MASPAGLLESYVLQFLQHAASESAPAPTGWPLLTHRSLHQCTLLASIARHLYHHHLSGSVTTVTQRDLYYSVIGHAAEQGEVNKLLMQIALATGLSRSELLVSAGSRGAVSGCLRIARLDVSCAGPNGVSIPGTFASTAAAAIPPLFCWARYLLIVEKDAVFQRLTAERIFSLVPCVLLSGRGFPDVATRALACALVASAAQQGNELIVVGLCDYNPSGVHVLLQYMRGNKKGSPESKQFSLPGLKWLGLHAADVPDEAPRVPFTSRDTAQLRNLLLELQPRKPARGRHCSEEGGVAHHREPSESIPLFEPWARELHQMMHRKEKAELEVIGPESGKLSAFVLSKLLRHQFF